VRLLPELIGARATALRTGGVKSDRLTVLPPLAPDQNLKLYKSRSNAASVVSAYDHGRIQIYENFKISRGGCNAQPDCRGGIRRVQYHKRQYQRAWK